MFNLNQILNLKMRQLQQMKNQTIDEQQKDNKQEIRYKIIKMFSTYVINYQMPFKLIQIIMEIIMYIFFLKFVLDYFAIHWYGSFIPVSLLVDITYYFSSLQGTSQYVYIFIFASWITLYWISVFLMFLYGIEENNLLCNIRKLNFLFNKNIICLPSLHFTLQLLSCNNPYKSQCLNTNLIVKILCILAQLIYITTILFQNYLDIQFIQRKKQQSRMKHTSITSIAVLLFGLVSQIVFYFTNDITSLIYINAATLILLILVIYRNDQFSQNMKLMQITAFAVLLAFALYLNLIVLNNGEIPSYPIIFICILVLLAIAQCKTNNLKFQLQNINKWPTSSIMISYAKTLRYYLSRKQQYYYKISIHGYMEVHRQKCDNPNCPSRVKFTQYQNSIFQDQREFRQLEQCYRAENIIKKIYDDGYKLNPISGALFLQNCTFLYQKNQNEKSLKNLLMINEKQLSIDDFYKYDFLKNKIHSEMAEGQYRFLDLIDEIQEKKLQKIMIKKLEQCSLITLQYWSILNQDHPDFTKLNEITLKLIQKRQQLKNVYQHICNLVYNEKLTFLYTVYLQNIQNYEQQFNNIYQQTFKDYKLQNKVVLQDWANSSGNILVISAESNIGEIIYINSNCASLFGYQKFQLIHQSSNILFLQDNKVLDIFLKEESYEQFFMMQKSGFIIKIKRKIQNYNSLQTGMAVVLNITPQISAYQCTFLFDNYHKIIGVTSSIISVLGIDPRFLQTEQKNLNYFHFQPSNIRQYIDSHSPQLKISQFMRQNYLDHSRNKNSLYKLKYQEDKQLYSTLDIFQMTNKKQGHLNYKNSNQRCKFLFEPSVYGGNFKYIGHYQSQDNFVSQLSKLIEPQREEQIASKNYADGISTYRLCDNVIQVIEDVQFEFFHQNMKDQEQQSQNILLTKQQQQQIFKNKKSFIKCIQTHQIGHYVYFVFIITAIIVISLYVSYFLIYRSKSIKMTQQNIRLKDLSEIVSIIALQQNFVSRLDLANEGLNYQNATQFILNYQKILKRLEQKQTLGFDTYPLIFSSYLSNSTVLSRQFMLTIINYANIFISKVKRPPANLQQIYAAFQTLDANQKQYLHQFGSEAEHQFQNFALQLQMNIINASIQSESINTVMIVLCSLAAAFSFFILLYSIYYLNRQKILIFQTFLDLPQTTIQDLSNKAEKVLLSLHTEESNDIFIDDDIQNTKKNSSTFAKKKSFKQITFNKIIYLKFIVFAFFFMGYIIQMNIIVETDLAFKIKSTGYFNVLAQLDQHLYQSLSDIQEQMITASKANFTSQTALNTRAFQIRVRRNYEKFLSQHYKTYGSIPQFHDSFQKIMYGNICSKQQTSYGSFNINKACDVGPMAEQGTLYIVEKMITQILSQNSLNPLQPIIFVYYEIISSANSLLTYYLEKQQERNLSDRIQELTIALLCWIFVILGILILWIIPNIKFYLNQINMIKNIILILPISYAVGSFKVKKYIHKLIKDQR